MNSCRLSPRPGAEGAAGTASLGLGPPAEFAASPADSRGSGAAAEARSSPLPLRPRRSPHLLPPPPPLSPRDKPLLPPCGLLKKLSLKEGAETPQPARRRGGPPRLRALTCARNRPAAPGGKEGGGSGAAPPGERTAPGPALTQPRRVRVEGDARHRRRVAAERPDQDGVLLGRGCAPSGCGRGRPRSPSAAPRGPLTPRARPQPLHSGAGGRGRAALGAGPYPPAAARLPAALAAGAGPLPAGRPWAERGGAAVRAPRSGPGPPSPGFMRRAKSAPPHPPMRGAGPERAAGLERQRRPGTGPGPDGKVKPS